MTVFQEIINRWHAAHPGFPLTSGEAGAPANPDDGAAAASVACAQNGAPVEPVLRLRSGWPVGRPRTIEMNWRQGATKLGLPYPEYRRHRLAGERWCSKHRGWVPEADFHSLRIAYCRPCWRAYHKRLMRERAGLSGRTITPRTRAHPTPSVSAPSRWRLGPNYPDHGRTP